MRKKKATDATLRNVRAAKRRHVSLAERITRLENGHRQTRSRVSQVERKVGIK